jgi:hypothetical protein
LHAGFRGFRRFVARKKVRCKLIGNRLVIPHDTIPSNVRYNFKTTIMNLFKVIIILMIGLTPISCENKTNKTTNLEDLNRKKSIDKENKYLINEKGVLGLLIGNTMPEKVDGYKLIKSVKIVEEGNEEPEISLTDDNAELLQIGFEYDQEKGNFNNKIGEILIKDKRFRTERSIGVESTIEDFINSYSNYYIWYTYISGMYVIQSRDMKIQFILNENGYIGKKNLMENDMVELKEEDFSANTRIVKIRIY